MRLSITSIGWMTRKCPMPGHLDLHCAADKVFVVSPATPDRKSTCFTPPFLTR